MSVDAPTVRRAELAADLVNAAGVVGAELDRAALAELLALWEQASGTADDAPLRLADGDDATLTHVVDLAGRLAAVFHGDDPLVELEPILAGLRVRPRVVHHPGRDAHLHYEAPDAPLAERLEVNLALGLATFVCEDPGRVGSCDAHGCPRVFVDTSRNGRRRFCSQPCANRHHVAQHRARRAAS